MSKPKPAWFLPQTRDHPPTGALRLGDIIASPFSPEEPINGDPPPPIPADSLRRFEQPDWSWTKEFARSHSGGIFAQFLQIIGIGADVDLKQSKSRSDIYNAERLVTEYFIPDRKYIEEVTKDDDVKDALTGPNRKSKVFMITGLKVAYGATKAVQAMNEHGIHGQVAVDLGPLTGAPVSVGPKGGTTSSTAEKLSSGKFDFVFGLQVRELRLRKGEVLHRKYDKGSLYGQKPDAGVAQEDGEVGDDVDFDELDVEELSLTDLGSVQTRTIDGGDDEEDVQFVFA